MIKGVNFFVMGYRNSLPCEMRQMSKNNFQINVHDTSLRIPSAESDYIDLTELITKIS